MTQIQFDICIFILGICLGFLTGFFVGSWHMAWWIEERGNQVRE